MRCAIIGAAGDRRRDSGAWGDVCRKWRQVGVILRYAERWARRVRKYIGKVGGGATGYVFRSQIIGRTQNGIGRPWATFWGSRVVSGAGKHMVKVYEVAPLWRTEID